MSRVSNVIFALGMMVSVAGSAHGAEVARREFGNQILEDIVDPSAAERLQIQRYQNVRSARFDDFLPDGSVLIATRFGQTAQLHRVAMPMGARQQLTYFEEPIGGAQAIAGTDLTLFSKDRGGDEWFQLFATDFKGKRLQLTEDGTRNSSAVLAHDGKTLVWSVAKKGSGDAEIMIAEPINPASRKVLFSGDGAMRPLDLSPDGKTVLITKYISIGESKIYLFDRATSKLREIAPDASRIAYDGGKFTTDGKSAVLISNYKSNVQRLVRMDITSGAIQVLSPPLAFDVEDFSLADNGDTLSFTVNEEGYSKLYLGSLKTGRFSVVKNLPPGNVSGQRLSRDGRKLGMSISSATTPGDVFVLDIGTAQIVRWTQSEIGEIDPQSLVAPTLVHFPSFDGTSIPAFVYKPKQNAGKAPVIINIHGGPEGQSRPGFSSQTQLFLAQLGAAVIYPNVRGSSGYGQTYLDMDNADKREESVKDIGALINWIKTQNDLDPNRIVVYGGSYGGYMVLAAMTHYSDRLLGGIEAFGISNFISFLENTEAYRRDLRRAEYGDERDPAMRAVFDRISPLNNVQKITKPMLVMQGWNDPRVPKSESDQIVTSLRDRAIPVSYLQFKDEGHGFRKKVNVDRQRDSEMAFLKMLFAN